MHVSPNGRQEALLRARQIFRSIDSSSDIRRLELIRTGSIVGFVEPYRRRDSIVLRRLATARDPRWHFTPGCPGWVQDRVQGLEKITPAEWTPERGPLCETCRVIRDRGRHRPDYRH
jgi:hypothetical protein